MPANPTPDALPPTEAMQAMERITELANRWEKAIVEYWEPDYDGDGEDCKFARKALLTAIAAALDEGRRDRERLDWIQSSVNDGTFRASVERVLGQQIERLNIREALDAARTTEGPR